MRALVLLLLSSATTLAQSAHPVPEDPRWLVFPGGEGPGAGKHVVFVAADQEYRSEQSMPMLAHLLAERHGFHTTVLFGQNADGLVDPTQKIAWEDPEVVHDIPGLEHLASADALVLFTRLLTLPAGQRAHLHAYLDSGKPIVAFRTANHGFLEFGYEVNGARVRFGEDVLGGSFRGHHGRWHADSTRGSIVAENREHAIVRGVTDVWGPSDVYRTYPEGESLPPGCTPLVMGQPLTGRGHDDPPNVDLIALPVAWVKTWTGASGEPARVFHSTMGSAKDFESAGMRRLAVNAVYWSLRLEAEIDPDASVEVVGDYRPLASGFAYEELGVRPRPVSDYDPRRPRAAWDEWKHAAALYIVTTPDGVDLAESDTVTDFPLLVRLEAETFPFAQARSGGEDLRFSDESDAALFHEIESWDAAAGTASVWVRIPTIRGQEVQAITMHWGHPHAGSTSDGAGVFGADSGGVWHLGPTLVDSSPHGLHGEDVRTTDVTGVVGRARSFGVGAAVLCGEDVTTLPRGDEPRSMSAWVRPTSFEDGPTIGGWGAQGAQHLSYLTLSSLGRTMFHGYAADPEGVTRAELREWHHVGVTLEPGEIRFYFDGALEHAAAITTLDTTSPSACNLGKHTPPSGRWSRHFHGDLDEVRFERVARSPAWMKLCFENQRSLQRLVGGPLPGDDGFLLGKSRTLLPEGEHATFESTAGGALSATWLVVDEERETVVAVNRLRYTFAAPRVSGDREITLRFRALYPDGVRERDFSVVVGEAIADPRVELTAPANWDGRSRLELRAAVPHADGPPCSYDWTIEGMAVIGRAVDGRYVLEHAWNDGALTVQVAVDNGGEPMVRSVTIDVTRPAVDPWIDRSPGEAEWPQDHQFVARGPDGTGPLHATGRLDDAERVSLELRANGELVANTTAGTDSRGHYALHVDVPAGLVAYDATLRAHAGDEVRDLHTATDIVCGDAYVIQGQSNAEAFDQGRADHPYRSPWIRSLGAPHSDPARARSAEWGEAVGFDRDGWNRQIGYWGMELAKMLVDAHEVPIFVINGAQGGTRIDQHQRDDADPTNVATIYGRLFWRVREARLTHGVRAVFWHQGENDQGAGGPAGAYGWENYRSYFHTLAASWKRDFPNLRHLYVFQIEPKACSMGTEGSDDRLREVQRRLAEDFSNLSVVATVGVRPPGGCHFPPEGYAAIAHAVYPLVARDQYGVRFDAPITSPNLLRAFPVSACELALEFDQPMTWDPALAEHFDLDGHPGKVLTGSAQGAVVLLELTQAAHHVTYVVGDRWKRDAPVLRGANGIAALSFCEVPIEPD